MKFIVSIENFGAFKQSFGYRLEQFRSKADLTIAEVSEATGIAVALLELVENGQMELSEEQILKLRTLGVNTNWLATGQGSMLIAPAQADRRSLADRLKIALKHRNKTQAELASGIGATDSQVSLWISGEHEPRGKNRHAIATFLNVNEAWLRTGSGPMDPADDYGAAPGGEAETEVDRRVAEKATINQDALVAEVNYLTKLVKEIKANGEEIPEAVRKRLIAAIDNLLGE